MRASAIVLGASAIVTVVVIGAAAPAAADTSKLAKDGVAIQERGALRGKNKLCCGYPLVSELDWALTMYWLAYETDFDEPHELDGQDPEGVVLYTRHGYFFGSFPEKFTWSLRMEGSGVLADGRVVNYAGRCDYGYGTCYEWLDPKTHPYGRGAGQRPLVPFKSVAVDPRFIPIGEPLYIPEFDGILMPDGTIHDGCVRADDTGGGIKKKKMDFFVETHANFRFILDQLWGTVRITPHVEEPRCEYLRDP